MPGIMLIRNAILRGIPTGASVMLAHDILDNRTTHQIDQAFKRAKTLKRFLKA